MSDEIPTQPVPRPVSCPDCGRAMPLDGPVWLCPACLAASFFGAEGAEPLGMDEPMREEGEMVGRYRLLEPIGEGGFGIVYRAEQTVPFQRQVALKLLKPGLDSRVVLARFDAERQALALLDHPNIARALDAGSSADGRPYFVMELVEGLPVNLFCARHRLNLNERLRVFLDICAGIEHAHSKGVIHRDLKPSNVLISEGRDGQAPKVTIIDFGIAKALWQELTPHTLYTHPRQMLGTPEYMSPEQALHGGLNIDTRADVYSLGALLYEMITGYPPLSSSQLAQVGLDEWVQAIRDHTPMRPSRRLATLGADAQARELLTARTENELDWVVLKALAKERERRYQTVREFAEDVRRFLEDEAVSARPPSISYLTRKFVKRHRGQVFAAAGAVVVLVAGSIISLGMAVRAEKAEKRTRQAFSLADSSSAEEKADGQRYGEAVALLCRALRLDPENREAAFRLFTLMAEAPAGIADCPTLNHGDSIWQGRFVPPEGRQIITAASRLGALVLWDWQPGQAKRLRSFVMPDPISAFAVSQDGRWVASGSISSTAAQARVWALADGSLRGGPLLMPLDAMAQKHGVQAQVLGLAFSPDGDRLYTAGTDKWLRAWDLETAAELWQVRCTSIPRCLAVSPDESRLAVGYDDTRLGLYEAKTGAVIHEAPAQRHRIDEVQFSPDGKKVLVGGGDTFSAVLDAATGQRHGNLEHYARITTVAQAAGGERVATGGQDAYVRLRSIKGQFVHAQAVPDAVRVLEFSADGQALAVGTQEPHAVVSLLNGRTGIPQGHPLQMHRVVEDLSFHPSGTRLLVTALSESATVLDIRPRQLHPRRFRFEQPILSGGFVPGTSRVYGLTQTGRLLRCGLEGGDAEALPALAGGSKPDAWAFGADEPYGAVASGNKLWLLDLREWRVRHTVELSGPLSEITLAPGGLWLLAREGGGQALRLFSMRTGEQVWAGSATAGNVTAQTVSQNGALVVTGHPQGRLTLFDIRKKTAREVQTRTSQDILTLTLNADGSRLISGSLDALLHVWDVTSGTEVPEAAGRTPRHSDNAMAGGVRTTYARSGDQFFSYNASDLRVRSFSAANGQPSAPYLTHRSPVNHIVQSPEGSLLLTAESDGQVSLWHLTRHQPISTSEPLAAPVVGLAFDASGSLALAAQASGEVQIWSLPPASGSVLPECFLRFAEGFGRWRLTSKNVLQVVAYESFDAARQEVLALPDDESDPQVAWMKWLASDPDKRPQRPD